MEINKVTKSNAIINACYRLTLTELQIMSYAVSMINPLADDIPLDYEIKVSDFAKIFNKDKNGIYSEIKDAVCERLWFREFSFINPDAADETIVLRWLSAMKYSKKKGVIEISFSPKIAPYLHQLKGNFTTYYLREVADFRSVASVRLYEILLMSLNKSKKDAHTTTISVDDLKNQLGMELMYNRFIDFKRRALSPARKEINKSSDIRIEFDVVRRGQTPTDIKFTITRKEPAKQIKETKRSTVSIRALERAKMLLKTAGDRLDVYNLEGQFYDYAAKKGEVIEKIDGAFIGFVKMKIGSGL